jgi:hypothetical protein
MGIPPDLQIHLEAFWVFMQAIVTGMVLLATVAFAIYAVIWLIWKILSGVYNFLFTYPEQPNYPTPMNIPPPLSFPDQIRKETINECAEALMMQPDELEFMIERYKNPKYKLTTDGITPRKA